LITATAQRTGRRVNVMTHCNAGWLATVDWGTALAPIYQAFQRGVPYRDRRQCRRSPDATW
jgi:methylthioribose-1-phosphate isomerase